MQTREGVGVMTDYQMRVLLNLIIDLVKEKRDPEKVIARLVAIRDGKADIEEME
jgi:hypothetical protein